MSDHILARIKSAVSMAALLLLAAACGGGGGGVGGTASPTAGVGSGGTGIGTVTGFGSLIIDGTRLDDSQAAYSSEAEQGSASVIPPTAVMLGHGIEFVHDAAGQLKSALVSPVVLGNVESVGADGILVLGIRVTSNSDPALGPVTHFVGYASPADVKAGDRIEVHGVLKTDAQGQASLQATLVIRKAAGTGFRATGLVSQYNAAAGSFLLNGVLVTTGTATVVPAGTALANGQLVTAWSDSYASNTLSAKVIRVKLPAAGTLTVSGIVSNYTNGTGFTVRNIAVETGKAVITPPGATFANGSHVVVAGTYDAGNQKLTASSIRVSTASSAPVHLHGTILNFVSTSSFTVRGVVVDASTAQFAGGTASQLANGVFVAITGGIENNVVRAATVEIVSTDPLKGPPGSMLNLHGTLVSLDRTAGAYTMALGSGAMVNGKFGGGVIYGNGAAGDLAVGLPLTVSGTMNAGVLGTSVVDFTTPAGVPVAVPPTGPGSGNMQGFAYGITSDGFMLNGIRIEKNGVSVRGKGMMGGSMLQPGSQVSVDVQFSGGRYTATAISVLD